MFEEKFAKVVGCKLVGLYELGEWFEVTPEKITEIIENELEAVAACYEA
jgi:hypothetical protein